MVITFEPVAVGRRGLGEQHEIVHSAKLTLAHGVRTIFQHWLFAYEYMRTYFAGMHKSTLLSNYWEPSGIHSQSVFSSRTRFTKLKLVIALSFALHE